MRGGFHAVELPRLTYNISRMAGMIRPGLARKATILPRKVGKSFSTVSDDIIHSVFPTGNRTGHTSML